MSCLQNRTSSTDGGRAGGRAANYVAANLLHRLTSCLFFFPLSLLHTGRTCRVISSSRSTAPWCSETSGSALASTTRTSWYGNPHIQPLFVATSTITITQGTFPPPLFFFFFLSTAALLFFPFFPPAVNPRFPLQGGYELAVSGGHCVFAGRSCPSHMFTLWLGRAALSGQSAGGRVNTAAGPKECHKVPGIEVFTLL